MKLHLPLMYPVFDSPQLEPFKNDFDNNCRIYIYSDPDDFEHDDKSHIYGLWVEYGTEFEKSMMFEVSLDDLELFATALQKSIEMIRRDYKELIRQKIKERNPI